MLLFLIWSHLGGMNGTNDFSTSYYNKSNLCHRNKLTFNKNAIFVKRLYEKMD